MGHKLVSLLQRIGTFLKGPLLSGRILEEPQFQGFFFSSLWWQVYGIVSILNGKAFLRFSAYCNTPPLKEHSWQNFRTSDTMFREMFLSPEAHSVWVFQPHRWSNDVFLSHSRFNSHNCLKVTHQMVALAVVSACFPFSLCLQQEQRGGSLFPSLRCETVRQNQTSRVASAPPEEQGAPTCWIRWLFICSFRGNATSQQIDRHTHYSSFISSSHAVKVFVQNPDGLSFGLFLTSDTDISYTYFVNTECVLSIIYCNALDSWCWKCWAGYLLQKGYVYIDVLIHRFKLVFIHRNVYWSHCI